MMAFLLQDPYAVAFGIAAVWVIGILVPVWVYQMTSPHNHLKRFPRQDQ